MKWSFFISQVNKILCFYFGVQLFCSLLKNGAASFKEEPRLDGDF